MIGRRLAFATLQILLFSAGAHAESVWVVGATIHPVEVPAIPNGVMRVENGRIVEIGSAMLQPAGAIVVDLAGKHVYPGFVHPGSPLGLLEINSVRGTVDRSEIGSNNAHLRTEVAFNADSLLLAPAIAGGVLTAHVVATGGLVAPTSAVMTLDGWNWRDMLVRSRVAVHVHFPEVHFDPRHAEEKEKEEFAKKKTENLRELSRIFELARAWNAAARARAQAGKRQAPHVDFDAASEALGPVLAGEIPLFLHADERHQIAQALDWAAKEGLTRLVLVSGPDAAELSERLAKSSIPVLLDGVLDLPDRRTDAYDAPFTAAARLHAAGVKIAIGDGGDAANARNLPFHAAMATAFGLPADAALRAITLSPAEILGVDDRVGSLAPGKDASFLVTTGDPLEIRTAIERVFLRGREFDLDRDRQRQLWKRYAARPALH